MSGGLQKKLEQGFGRRFAFTPVGSGLERVFVFAGQSAPFAGGFREELSKFTVIRNHFDRADKIAALAGLPTVSHYLTDSERLNAAEQLEVQTLALFTLEVGLSRALMQSGCCPVAVSGHSFGEYAALVVSGILSFNDCVKIIIHREKISPAPNEAGYLVAVSADLETLRTVLEGRKKYFISHQNTLKQSVVASPWEAVVDLEDLLRSKKLGYRRLTVPQPYHSPLLECTRPAMEEFLRKGQFDIQAPRIPVFSSVTREWITRDCFSRQKVIEIISGQMIEPIDFIRQSRELSRFKTVVELGPSNLCAQLLTACVKDIQVSGFKEWLIVDKFNTEEKREPKNIRQETLALVKRTIARITGYEIESIKVEDRLQEDLGLDSLKLTEVAVSVIEELGEDPNRRFQQALPRTIEDFAWNVDQIAQQAVVKTSEEARVGHSLASLPFLNDHRIGGHAYFPFVLGVGQFYDDSSLKKEDSLTLYDIRVEKPMVMTATNRATWKRFDDAENESWELGVLEPSLFASARAFGRGSQSVTSPPEIPSTHFRYDSSGLFHGPRFQIIEKLDWKSNEAVAQLTELGDLPWYLSLDSAFQIMGLVGLRDKMVYLPIGAERIDFIRRPEIGAPYLMWLQNLHHDSRFVTADGALFQGKQLLVEFKGLRSACGGQSERQPPQSHQTLCEVPTGEK